MIKADTPFARNLALSPDQQWLYVRDGKEIAVVDRKSLTIVGTINPRGMIGAGHQIIATDLKGRSNRVSLHESCLERFRRDVR